MSISSTKFVKGDKYDWNKPNGNCPACYSYDKPRGGKLVLRKGRYGVFLGCSRYPDCKYLTTSFRKR